MISTILVYVLLLGLLKGGQQKITHDDASTFQIIALISLGTGGLCTLLFQILVKSNPQNLRHEDVEESSSLIHTNSEEEPSLPYPSNSTNENDESVSTYLTNGEATPIHEPVQTNQSTKEVMNLKDWLCEPQTYQVACVYMSARLFVNTTQTYIPLYIQETLGLKARELAAIPIIMYVSGFFVSLIIKPITMRIGNKFMFVLSCLIGLMSCLLMNPGKRLF